MKESLPYIAPWLIHVFRYFIMAGIPFMVFYILCPRLFYKNKIQPRGAKQEDFKREIWHSFQSTFVLAGVGLLLIKTPLFEYTKLYKDLHAYPLWWIPLSIFCALVMHDTYFYWMHRAVHHPKVFKLIHLLHHKSTNPSPWAAYSFQASEAFLEAMIAPILLFTLPFHPIALITYTFIAFSINVYGHLGYEIAPRWLRHTFLFELLVTSTFHNMHHAKFRGNYGLYFRFWDRLMGTEIPNYVQAYDKIQTRRFGESPGTLPWKTASVLFLILLGLGVLSLRAQTQIVGEWQNGDRGELIRIYEDEGRYFGHILASPMPQEGVKLQEQDKIVLLGNFKKRSSHKYCCGTIYLIKQRKTFAATLILLDENTLYFKTKYEQLSGGRAWKKI